MVLLLSSSLMFFADGDPQLLVSSADPVLLTDQVQQNDSTDFNLFSNIILAQSFVPQMTPLTRVDVKINKPRMVSSNLRLSIRASLNGSNLVSQTVASVDVPFYIHWISFDIVDIDVNRGQTYFIVLESDTPASNSYRWRSVYDEQRDHYEPGVLYRYFTESEIWETVETQTDFVDACFRTYSYQSDVDLVCEGYLNWTNITPGQKDLTGFFTVENDGTPFSRLDWKILTWPGWGTWEFSLMNQSDLTPEEGATRVQITVEAPHVNVPDVYRGKIVIVNEDDPSDVEEISARLVTGKKKKETMLFSDWLMDEQDFFSSLFLNDQRLEPVFFHFIKKYL